MGFLDTVRAFLRGDSPAPLVDYPEHFRQVEVGTLTVHTANLSPDTDEKLVIITLSSLEPLRLLDAPVRLTSPGQRSVTFVPVDTRSDPALDPNLGWIVPVTPETAAELRALPAGPGAHELSSLHVGIAVEGD